MSDELWSRDETEDPPPEFEPTPEGYIRFEQVSETRRPKSVWPGKWKQFPDKTIGVWCPECSRGKQLAQSFAVTVDGLSEGSFHCERCGLFGPIHLVGYDHEPSGIHQWDLDSDGPVPSIRED